MNLNKIQYISYIIYYTIYFVAFYSIFNNFFLTIIFTILCGHYGVAVLKHRTTHYTSVYDNKKLGAYLINLDRAKNRLEYAMHNIRQLSIPVERISAVDGKTLTNEVIQEIVDIKSYTNYFKMLPEKGTIGCSLSHKLAWEEFLSSKNEFALIFEDDISFNPKILQESIDELMQVVNTWDIVSFEVNHQGYPRKVKNLPNGKSLVFYLTNVKHAGAYLINRKAANKLLSVFYPIKMPVDHLFTRSWELGLKFCGAEPRIVHQKYGDTQIKIANDIHKIKTPKVLILNTLFNINTSMINSIYNLCCYLTAIFNK